MRDMAKRVPQSAKLADLPINIIGLFQKRRPRDTWAAVWPKHAGDLLQRKTRRFPQRNQLELQEDSRRKLSP